MRFLASLITTFIITVAGCASTPTILADSNRELAQASEQRGEIMFHLLAGEMAGQLGDLISAATHYYEAAILSDDPAVAERGARIALYSKEGGISYQAVRRWLELAPDNLEANQVAAILAARGNDGDEAGRYLEQILLLSSDETSGFDSLNRLFSSQQEAASILDVVTKLVEARPDSAAAQSTLAQLAIRAGDFDLALLSLGKALALDPQVDTLVLRARLLASLERDQEALTDFEAALQLDSENSETRLHLARHLVKMKRFEDARGAFEQLHAKNPEDGDLLFALGLLSIDTDNLEDAKRYLTKLEQSGERVNEARYYLGRVAQTGEHPEEAIAWFNQVSEGEHRLEAMLQIAELQREMGHPEAAMEQLSRLLDEYVGEEERVLIYLGKGVLLRDQRRHQEAYDLYDSALTELPTNIDLLYAQGLVAEKLDRVDLLEENMQTILAHEPENAHALNALGYTLADRTDRLQEALDYIERAYQLEPDEPAILDSMGWVHYRLGDLETALEFLQHAYNTLQDGEIGAHLGEVLWELGRPDEGRAIWQEILNSDPDNEFVIDTMRRYLP